MSLSARSFRRLMLGLLAGAAPLVAAQQLQVQCPSTITGQYTRLAAFSVDGPKASIDGLVPQFEPRSTMRLVAPRLAMAHGGEQLPSEALPPDQLTFELGKPMKWTLWDGRPPEPTGVVHIVCEYEGGMLLHRSLGRSVRQCTLESRAARPDARNGLAREVATRAVFTCR